MTPRRSGTGAPQSPAEQTCPRKAGPLYGADIGCGYAPILFRSPDKGSPSYLDFFVRVCDAGDFAWLWLPQ